MLWCDLDLTFDLAVMTLTFKILSKLYFGHHKVKKLILGRDISYECRCATLYHTVCSESLPIFVLYHFFYISWL